MILSFIIFHHLKLKFIGMKNRAILFLIFVFLIGLGNSCFDKNDKLNKNQIKSAEKIIGINFSKSERDSLIDELAEAKEGLNSIRETKVLNSISPKLTFDPRPINFEINMVQEDIIWGILDDVFLPKNKEDLAFYTISELASLIKNKKISSTELTKLYINRLKKFGDTLECVICITEELALRQAKKADDEIANGFYKGPLHGIPYGVKDLLAVEGYKTTWGAAPYKDQKIEYTATVVKKLEDVGAVLIAKLSLGALAMGDVWFDGVTRNPWDLTQGSSGSSAGPASATSAGLVAFAIGSETWGSIVSPSTRCGVTGLRPTYGRVSKDGAMALSWTMDKLGPICRNAFDCAIVFDVIRGKDKNDQSTVEYPFNYKKDVDLSKLKVAYLKDLFEEDYRGNENDKRTLKLLRKIGVNFDEIKLPDNLPIKPLAIILEAEAGAAFDELTRSNKDDMLVAQHKYAWPNTFRKSRFIPAVEYIQASRIRTLLIEEFHALIKDYDVIVSPSFGGNQLLMTNLTGHPCVVVPNGFDEKKHPTSISFIGNLYDEAIILSVAKAYQDNSEFDDIHPEFFK
jgi:Asp-tRNA(Asn)/Glu-tRNA(Gln) amidotransferase A subunit family amidase